jgi:hypothetical protein
MHNIGSRKSFNPLAVTAPVIALKAALSLAALAIDKTTDTPVGMIKIAVLMSIWERGCRVTNILLGLQITLARTIDIACAECGETAVAIGSGTNTDILALRCICCQRHRGHLPKAVADFLVTAIDKFGRPIVPITVRDSQLAAPSGAVAVEISTRTPRHSPWQPTLTSTTSMAPSTSAPPTCTVK